MDEKWFGITMCVFFMFAFGSLAVDSYGRQACRTAYAQSNWSVQDIKAVCQ